jgi:hypothetical protein
MNNLHNLDMYELYLSKSEEIVEGELNLKNSFTYTKKKGCC